MLCTTLGKASPIDYKLHNTQLKQLHMATLARRIKNGRINN